jgi:hypothetical protein
MKYRTLLIDANIKYSNDYVFCQEELQKKAEEHDCYVFEDGKLYLELDLQDPDPEMAQLLDEKFWELV